MKLRTSVLSLVLLLSILGSIRGQDTVLLFHPTAYNLEVFEKLMEEGVFQLDGYHVLGVYHPGETYDYSKAEAYIKKNYRKKNSLFSLREIQGELGPENLFRENPATGQFRELFSCSKGALFMGGPDIPPVAYGEKIHLLTRVTDPFRHYLELSYLFHLLGGSQNEAWTPYMEEFGNYMVTGICLGMQTMHVATGGSMIQDIPSELYGIWEAEDILALPGEQMHRNYYDYLSTGCEGPTSYHFHRIALETDKILSKGTGTSAGTAPLVLSSHHQAIEAPGPQWEVVATSMDGKIIEAIHHKQYPQVIGIQFHPEKPGLFDPSIEHPKACGSTINFQKAIANSESYSFHVALWKQFGLFLQNNRESR
jgi:putative glutamine amidotransferase